LQIGRHASTSAHFTGEAEVELPAVQVSQSPEDKFREYLASRPRPQRYTGQQRDMVQYIFSQHNHFDADQLIDDLKREGFRVSRATVYRTLAKLVDAGLLRRLDVGPRMYYEHDYGYPQHEHMVCQQCNKMIEFQSTAIGQVIRDVFHEHNFQSAGHTFIIRGICAECNRARVTKRRLDLI
jgi:Fur family transcriptional regulator, ferric uptake regulator